MKFFQELAKRPWVAEQGAIDDLDDGVAYALPTAKVGLRLFLAVATVVFSLLIISYAERMGLADWRNFPDPWLLWVNTAMLILSSIALQWAQVSAGRGQTAKVKIGLVGGGVYALAFIAGQLLAWQSIASSGFLASANPSIAFFYLLTGAHVVHLLGGLVALVRTITKAWNVDIEKARLQMSVELCTVYWHYLLVVWLVLFGLMLFT